MNLTDRQRKLAFAGIIVLLVAVGVYITLTGPGGPGGTDAGSGDKPTATPTSSASAPRPTTSAADLGIYQLLPFSRQEFGRAAGLAQGFVAAYGTYRYDEKPATYVKRLAGMTDEELRTQLARGAATAGIVEQRKRDREVATGTASVDAVRNISKSSIIFLVTGRQQVSRAGKTSEDSEQYAVTVSRDGDDWTVYSFAPADEGQAGDTG